MTSIKANRAITQLDFQRVRSLISLEIGVAGVVELSNPGGPVAKNRLAPMHFRKARRVNAPAPLHGTDVLAQSAGPSDLRHRLSSPSARCTSERGGSSMKATEQSRDMGPLCRWGENILARPPSVSWLPTCRLPNALLNRCSQALH